MEVAGVGGGKHRGLGEDHIHSSTTATQVGPRGCPNGMASSRTVTSSPVVVVMTSSWVAPTTTSSAEILVSPTASMPSALQRESVPVRKSTLKTTITRPVPTNCLAETAATTCTETEIQPEAWESRLASGCTVKPASISCTRLLPPRSRYCPGPTAQNSFSRF